MEYDFSDNDVEEDINQVKKKASVRKTKTTTTKSSKKSGSKKTSSSRSKINKRSLRAFVVEPTLIISSGTSNSSDSSASATTTTTASSSQQQVPSFNYDGDIINDDDNSLSSTPSTNPTTSNTATSTRKVVRWKVEMNHNILNFIDEPFLDGGSVGMSSAASSGGINPSNQKETSYEIFNRLSFESSKMPVCLSRRVINCSAPLISGKKSAPTNKMFVGVDGDETAKISTNQLIHRAFRKRSPKQLIWLDHAPHLASYNPLLFEVEGPSELLSPVLAEQIWSSGNQFKLVPRFNTNGSIAEQQTEFAEMMKEEWSTQGRFIQYWQSIFLDTFVDTLESRANSLALKIHNQETLLMCKRLMYITYMYDYVKFYHLNVNKNRKRVKSDLVEKVNLILAGKKLPSTTASKNTKKSVSVKEGSAKVNKNKKKRKRGDSQDLSDDEEDEEDEEDSECDDEDDDDNEGVTNEKKVDAIDEKLLELFYEIHVECPEKPANDASVSTNNERSDSPLVIDSDSDSDEDGEEEEGDGESKRSGNNDKDGADAREKKRKLEEKRARQRAKEERKQRLREFYGSDEERSLIYELLSIYLSDEMKYLHKRIKDSKVYDDNTSDGVNLVSNIEIVKRETPHALASSQYSMAYTAFVNALEMLYKTLLGSTKGARNNRNNFVIELDKQSSMMIVDDPILRNSRFEAMISNTTSNGEDREEEEKGGDLSGDDGDDDDDENVDNSSHLNEARINALRELASGENQNGSGGDDILSNLTTDSKVKLGLTCNEIVRRIIATWSLFMRAGAYDTTIRENYIRQFYYETGLIKKIDRYNYNTMNIKRDDESYPRLSPLPKSNTIGGGIGNNNFNLRFNPRASPVFKSGDERGNKTNQIVPFSVVFYYSYITLNRQTWAMFKEIPCWLLQFSRIFYAGNDSTNFSNFNKSAMEFIEFICSYETNNSELFSNILKLVKIFSTLSVSTKLSIDATTGRLSFIRTNNGSTIDPTSIPNIWLKLCNTNSSLNVDELMKVVLVENPLECIEELQSFSKVALGLSPADVDNAKLSAPTYKPYYVARDKNNLGEIPLGFKIAIISFLRHMNATSPTNHVSNVKWNTQCQVASTRPSYYVNSLNKQINVYNKTLEIDSQTLSINIMNYCFAMKSIVPIKSGLMVDVDINQVIYVYRLPGESLLNFTPMPLLECRNLKSDCELRAMSKSGGMVPRSSKYNGSINGGGLSLSQSDSQLPSPYTSSGNNNNNNKIDVYACRLGNVLSWLKVCEFITTNKVTILGNWEDYYRLDNIVDQSILMSKIPEKYLLKKSTDSGLIILMPMAILNQLSVGSSSMPRKKKGSTTNSNSNNDNDGKMWIKSWLGVLSNPNTRHLIKLASYNTLKDTILHKDFARYPNIYVPHAEAMTLYEWELLASVHELPEVKEKIKDSYNDIAKHKANVFITFNPSLGNYGYFQNSEATNYSLLVLHGKGLFETDNDCDLADIIVSLNNERRPCWITKSKTITETQATGQPKLPINYLVEKDNQDDEDEEEEDGVARRMNNMLDTNQLLKIQILEFCERQLYFKPPASNASCDKSEDDEMSEGEEDEEEDDNPIERMAVDETLLDESKTTTTSSYGYRRTEVMIEQPKELILSNIRVDKAMCHPDVVGYISSVQKSGTTLVYENMGVTDFITNYETSIDKRKREDEELERKRMVEEEEEENDDEDSETRAKKKKTLPSPPLNFKKQTSTPNQELPSELFYIQMGIPLYHVVEHFYLKCKDTPLGVINLRRKRNGSRNHSGSDATDDGGSAMSASSSSSLEQSMICFINPIKLAARLGSNRRYSYSLSGGIREWKLYKGYWMNNADPHNELLRGSESGFCARSKKDLSIPIQLFMDSISFRDISDSIIGLKDRASYERYTRERAEEEAKIRKDLLANNPAIDTEGGDDGNNIDAILFGNSNNNNNDTEDAMDVDNHELASATSYSPSENFNEFYRTQLSANRQQKLSSHAPLQRSASMLTILPSSKTATTTTPKLKLKTHPTLSSSPSGFSFSQ